MDKIENGIKELKIIKIKDLLKKDLKIPEYQRPYKWTLKNINQLIDDILYFNDKKSYRLGTIVFHETNENLYIVDGQQRIITLFLIAYAIKNNKEKKVFFKEDIKIDWEFKNNISQYNINKNYKEIQRRIDNLDEKTIKFLFEKCEIVVVILNNISEAFQFFDSQNARGKDLEPHDLLKAYHLREMNNISEIEKTKIITFWENINSNELSEFFEKYLFRIKNWSKNRSARFFTKNDIDIFKGIRLKDENQYSYTKIYNITNYYVDNYNSNYNRNIDNMTMNYPFQMDQVLINGKRFFEMIAYYKNLQEQIEFKFKDNNIIKEILNKYDGKNRIGDKYVRNLFDCALFYYVDKFGEIEIEKVIEKLFIWAYTLRLKQHSVQLASMDNYTKENKKIFHLIREATSHQEITNMDLEILNENQIVATKIDKLKNEFKGMHYVKQ